MSKRKGSAGYNRSNSFFRRHNYRNLIILLLVVLAAIVSLSAVSYTWVKDKLDKINIDDGIDFSNSDMTMPAEEEDPDFEAMHDITDASSLTEFLKGWAMNGGEKMYSKDVINVLLCGVDSEDGTISGGRSDAMILVSLNKNTKKINLISFYRDSYTYMNINGDERYYKLNSVYNWGGPATLVETLENNYKIEIDNYVSVDFVTFPKLIDALGGVVVDVQEYEAKFIDRTTHSMTRDFPYGDDVRIDGKEALVYSRIRKCDSDSDISRTRRQRNLITGIIDSTKEATFGQISNALDLSLEYVRTNYKKSEILAYTAQAITQNWMEYDMEQVATPNVDSDGTGVSATINKEFFWVVDYSRAAQELQMLIYGKTNIEIDDTNERQQYINSLFRNTTYSSGDKASYSSDNNEDDEETTVADDEDLLGNIQDAFSGIFDNSESTEAENEVTTIRYKTYTSYSKYSNTEKSEEQNDEEDITAYSSDEW